MICLVRLHCHMSDIKLDISQYKRLLSLKYNIYDNYTQQLAVKSIKTIQKVCNDNNNYNENNYIIIDDGGQWSIEQYIVL